MFKKKKQESDRITELKFMLAIMIVLCYTIIAIKND